MTRKWIDNNLCWMHVRRYISFVAPIFLLLLVSLFTYASTDASRISDRIQRDAGKVFKNYIESIGKKAARLQEMGLRPLVTPSFPAHLKGRLVSYIYAIGFSPSMADGIHVFEPFAMAYLDPASGEISYEVRDSLIKELGIQGESPLPEGDKDLYGERWNMAEGALLRYVARGRPTKEEILAMQSFYCKWLRYNGVIALELKRLHKDFLDRIGCK